MNADGTAVPNNAKGGTTPYVPETPMSSFQTSIGAVRPFGVVSRSFDRIQGNAAQRDVRGLTMCPMRLPALRPLPHIVIPGTPREGRRESALPVQKQAAGARAAWSHTSRPPLMTTLFGRRWVARGGPEGRGRKNRDQRTATGAANSTSRGLTFNGDGLELEPGIEEQGSRPDKSPRRKLLGEIAPIDLVEVGIVLHIGAVDRHRHEIVHCVAGAL